MEKNVINIKYGFKAFDKDLKCKDFQYEIGAIYDLEKAPIICVQGYHFCDSIEKVYNYYPKNEDTRVCIVEILGDIDAIDENGTDFNSDYLENESVFFNFKKIDKYCTNKIKILAEIKNPLDSVKIYFSRKKDKSSLPKETEIEKKLKPLKIGECICTSSTYDTETKKRKTLKLICISKQKGKYIFSFDKCVGKCTINEMNTFLDNFIGNEDILPKKLWDIVEEIFIPSEYEVFGSWIYGEPDDEPWKPFEYYKYIEGRMKSEFWWLRSPLSSTYCYVNDYGVNSYNHPSNGYGVAPCLVIDEKYFEESGQNDENDYIEF